jgi:hypothetical protein
MAFAMLADDLTFNDAFSKVDFCPDYGW